LKSDYGRSREVPTANYAGEDPMGEDNGNTSLVKTDVAGKGGGETSEFLARSPGRNYMRRRDRRHLKIVEKKKMDLRRILLLARG